MFIVVDNEIFNSLQKKRRIAHYIKLVEAGQEQDRDSLFPGWMKCSLKGLWDM
jgi:hypothetical protein